jgi:putative restriction endonuclease
LITFDDDLKLQLSPRLKRELPQPAVETNFGEYANRPLDLPSDAAWPELSFLAEHRAKIFKKS